MTSDMMTDEERPQFRRPAGGRRALGLSLIAVGLVLFAQQVGYLSRHPQGWVWTLIPVVIGLVHLFEPGRRSLGLMLLTWGLLLCAHQLELLQLNRSWPLLVVASGAGILLRGSERGSRRHRRES